MEWIWMILSLAGVLGLFFVLVFALKKLNGGNAGFVNGHKMKVIDRVAVGRDGMLAVVSVAGKLMLVGVTGQHIEKLSDLDMTPEEYNAQQPAAEPKNGMPFAAAVAEVIRKKGAGKDNGNGQGNDKTEQ